MGTIGDHNPASRFRRGAATARKAPLVALTFLAFFLTGVVGSAAHAANISASVPGAQANTENYPGFGERAEAWVKDTLSDNKEAVAYYQRAGESRKSIVADGGNGSTARSGHASNKIYSIQACVRNHNPFDPNQCSDTNYA